LFFQTGSSNISAVNGDMSTKFGLLIDFDLKAVTSTNAKPKVVLSGGAVGGPIWTKFGSLMQNNTPIMPKWSRWKPKAVFQYGRRLFSKPEVVISQP